MHVELTPPQTTPADAFGGSQDVIRHRNAGVLVDKGDGKAEVFQTGELVQIGTGWRVIDGPSAGAPSFNEGPAAGADAPPPVPEEIKEFVKQLSELKDPSDPAGLAEVPHRSGGDPGEDRRQVDGKRRSGSVAAAAPRLLRHRGRQRRRRKPPNGLTQWKTQIDKTAPKSPIAAFATFRSLAVENTTRMKAAGDKTADIAKVQAWWKDQLELFVKDFPNVEETAEAMFRLAMAHEFSGKDGETQAKQWYGTLAK